MSSFDKPCIQSFYCNVQYVSGISVIIRNQIALFYYMLTQKESNDDNNDEMVQ